MSKFRTDATAARYEEHRKGRKPGDPCLLCSVPSLTEFEFWRIIPNEFPYDRLMSRHDLLIPKRCCDDNDLTVEEHAELIHLRDTVLNEDYDTMMTNMPKYVTIPNHFHYHLVVFKEGLEGK